MLTKGQGPLPLRPFPFSRGPSSSRWHERVAEAPFTNEAVTGAVPAVPGSRVPTSSVPTSQGRILDHSRTGAKYAVADQGLLWSSVRSAGWRSGTATAWQAYLEEHEDSYAKAQQEVLPGPLLVRMSSGLGPLASKQPDTPFPGVQARRAGRGTC